MADPKATQFLESLYARVDKQVREIVAAMLPTVAVAAQDDGLVIANQHRILNFQGAGVVVTEDPARRRVNINVPGAPTATSADTSVYSAAGAPHRALTLWNGSTNVAPPANWQTVAFVDSGWGAAVATSVVQTYSNYTPGVGIWSTTGPPSGNPVEQGLIRHTFTLPAGDIASATLRILGDSQLDAAYINGTLVGSHGGTAWTTPAPIGADLPVSPALLVAGGSNVLAAMVTNTLVPPATGGLVYRLTVNYVSGGVDTRYQLLSEKDQANGYAGLDAGVRVPTARLGSGTANSTTFLRGDQSWAAASTNAITVKEVDNAPSVTATTLVFPNGTLTDNGGGEVQFNGSGISSSSTLLGADVTLTSANTFYDGPSLSLAAGTWLLVGQVHMTNDAADAPACKLWDGTTVVSSAGAFNGGGTNNGVTLHVSAIVTPGSTTTYKISAASATTGGILRRAVQRNGSGNNASGLVALKIG